MTSSSPHFTTGNKDWEKDKTEGDCCIFKPMDLNIIWGNDTRYWRLPAETRRLPAETSNNDPEQAAELVQVCWLEVTGTIENLPRCAGAAYEISFKVKLKSDAFGLIGQPLFVMAKIGKKSRYSGKRVVLKEKNENEAFDIPQLDPDNKLVVKDDSHDNDRKLYFGLYEVWSGRWKGGLQLLSATVKKVV